MVNVKFAELEQILRRVQLDLEDSRAKSRLLEKRLDAEISKPVVARSYNPTFDETLKQQISEIDRHKERLE